MARHLKNLRGDIFRKKRKRKGKERNKMVASRELWEECFAAVTNDPKLIGGTHWKSEV